MYSCFILLYVADISLVSYLSSTVKAVEGMSNLFGAVGHIFIPGFCACQTMLQNNLGKSDHIFFFLEINAFNGNFLAYFTQKLIEEFFLKICVSITTIVTIFT